MAGSGPETHSSINKDEQTHDKVEFTAYQLQPNTSTYFFLTNTWTYFFLTNTCEQKAFTWTTTAHVEELLVYFSITTHVEQFVKYLSITTHVEQFVKYLSITTHVEQFVKCLSITTHVEQFVKYLSITAHVEQFVEYLCMWLGDTDIPHLCSEFLDFLQVVAEYDYIPEEWYWVVSLPGSSASSSDCFLAFCCWYIHHVCAYFSETWPPLAVFDLQRVFKVYAHWQCHSLTNYFHTFYSMISSNFLHSSSEKLTGCTATTNNQKAKAHRSYMHF
jgi:hypothetical protein